MATEDFMSLENREFQLSDADFNRIRDLVSQKVGIVLADHKKQMIYSRLVRRLREHKLDSFTKYIDFLTGPGGDEEIVDFVNAVTTNLTSFFREPHHFEYLSENVFKPLSGSADKRLRVWSAGCSSGMEPYTIAMVLQESLTGLAGWDAKILATDIDTNMLNTGSNGIYVEEATKKIPANYHKHFSPAQPNQYGEPQVEMSKHLKSLTSFKQLNLLEDWPMKGPFDVIFCRNVVIYFDKPTQKIIFNKYADLLKPGGHLFIGHSENLFNVCDRFESLGKTIYRKAE